MAYCTKCGGNLEQEAIFCTNCGERSNPEVTNQVETRSENRNFQGSNYKNKYNRMKGIMISIAVLIILAVAIYLIYPKITNNNQHSQHVPNNVEKKDNTQENVKAPEKNVKVPEKNPTNTQTIPSYINRLEQLKIYDGNRSLSVGSWDITQIDGVINLTANNISPQNLQLIFNLYDSGDISPIRDWAIKVANIADEVAMSKNTSWYIHVGNLCVAQYPHTLSNEDLSFNAGSCGYSIPVLEGNSKNDLAIVIHTMVYDEVSTTNEFLLPTSSVRKLTQVEIDYFTKDELRIARNEIYARHGYIFKSDDLRNYFLSKSWYSPDVTYDGKLSEIETYNVNLIKAREEYIN